MFQIPCRLCLGGRAERLLYAVDPPPTLSGLMGLGWHRIFIDDMIRLGVDGINIGIERTFLNLDLRLQPWPLVRGGIILGEEPQMNLLQVPQTLQIADILRHDIIAVVLDTIPLETPTRNENRILADTVPKAQGPLAEDHWTMPVSGSPRFRSTMFWSNELFCSTHSVRRLSCRYRLVGHAPTPN